MVKPVGWNQKGGLRCRYGFKAEEIVDTPSGKKAKLVFLRSDEKWDALYQDTYVHLAGVVLDPRLITKVPQC